MSSKYINIINFVRGVEPRNSSLDLIYPVKKQIELLKKYGYPSTFLVQYDALINDGFLSVFRTAPNNTEFGLWFEVVQQLVEKVGIKWNGREGFSWDWHVNPGFLEAYGEDEKIKIIDEAMRCFKEKFGYYPKSAGSWLIDSFSMKYMSDKYKVKAFCICREQYGTDGYTLWGGPFNQGYYPSVNNMLVPASEEENMIHTPVFRMLGTDPIYEYDSRLDSDYNIDYADTVYTMEPVWASGRDSRFIDWYYKTVFCNESIENAYMQLGQENSFGWGNMREGIEKQFEYLKDKKDAIICTLEFAGTEFSKKYRRNPECAVSADSDWRNGTNQSFYYNCSSYRANVFSDGKSVWFRDMRFYSDDYKDEYLSKPASENTAKYIIPPVMDGYLWSGNGCRAGLYLSHASKITSASYNDRYLLETDNGIIIRFNESGIELCGIPDDFFLEMRCGNTEGITYRLINDEVMFDFSGFKYSMITNGCVEKSSCGFVVKAKERSLTLFFKQA